MNYLGGFRNSLTLVLTGLDVEAKADLALRTIVGLGLEQARQLAADPVALAAASSLDVARALRRARLQRPGRPAAAGRGAVVPAADREGPGRQKAGKPFTAPVIEATLSSYPGMFPTTPPGPASPYGVYWPTTVARDARVGGGQPRWRGRARRWRHDVAAPAPGHLRRRAQRRQGRGRERRRLGRRPGRGRGRGARARGRGRARA